MIKKDKLRPLSDLIADDDFYGDAHVGINYAQARYLLMYLQDQGKLPEFYKKFRAAHADELVTIFQEFTKGLAAEMDLAA